MQTCFKQCPSSRLDEMGVVSAESKRKWWMVTPLELAVAIGTAAVLVGCIYSMYFGVCCVGVRSRGAIAEDEMKTLSWVVACYRLQEGRYPRDFALHDLVGTYLEEAPVDPWGAEYHWDADRRVLFTYGGPMYRDWTRRTKDTGKIEVGVPELCEALSTHQRPYK